MRGAELCVKFHKIAFKTLHSDKSDVPRVPFDNTGKILIKQRENTARVQNKTGRKKGTETSRPIKK